MPTIYYVYQDGFDGGYYRSLKEARKDAQDQADYENREIEITKCTVPRVTLKLFLDALNARGWAIEQETIAVVKPRKKKREDDDGEE